MILFPAIILRSSSHLQHIDLAHQIRSNINLLKSTRIIQRTDLTHLAGIDQ